ncbi:MAG: sugar isomerase [Eubacteriales bacterium]|nr:sugar isomerase [Eubacteriales bacterium]
MTKNWTKLILLELNDTLLAIDENKMDDLIEELCKKERKVFVVGVGRVLISLKSWVKRLCHMGIDINFVGSETEKPIQNTDLLIVASSSGESIFPYQIAKKAKKYNANIFYIGCTKDSSIDQISNNRLILKGHTKLSNVNEYKSIQPMSTLFEQQLFLLCDIIALEIMHKNSWNEEVVKEKHANLE